MSVPNWVETLGSPRVSGDGTTERIYMALAGKGVTLLNSYTDLLRYNDGYFRRDRSSVQSGVYDTVTLVFTGTLEGSVSSGERTTYEISNSPTARDIRLLENYKTCWRYNLYGYVSSGGSVPSVPGWWSTATDLTIPSGSIGTYVWGESNPGGDSEGSWTILKSRTVAADTYPYPAPTVTETVYVSSESRAGNLVQTVGRCKKPGKTFGYLTAAKYWQVISCNVSKVNNKWAVRTSYQYAPAGWDGRIIPGGDSSGGDV